MADRQNGSRSWAALCLLLFFAVARNSNVPARVLLHRRRGDFEPGVESLAASMTLPVDTLSDEIEPYLLREQFIVRSPRGRVATARAYQVLGRPMKPAPPEERQPGLFD